jgi:hypothetical protein
MGNAEYFFSSLNSPTRARAASFLRFLDHTQWHITVSRTTLDEGSARCRDIYWEHTTLTRDRHPCCLRDSNSRSLQAIGRTPSPCTARRLESALKNTHAEIVCVCVCVFLSASCHISSDFCWLSLRGPSFILGIYVAGFVVDEVTLGYASEHFGFHRY